MAAGDVLPGVSMVVPLEGIGGNVELDDVAAAPGVAAGNESNLRAVPFSTSRAKRFLRANMLNMPVSRQLVGTLVAQ